MKNYLEMYSAKATPKFQAGGAMPAGEPMPAEQAPAAPQGGGADIQGMLMQFAETQDPQLAVAICNELLAMMGGGAAPEMGSGGRMNYKAPMFKKGGKL